MKIIDIHNRHAREEPSDLPRTEDISLEDELALILDSIDCTREWLSLVLERLRLDRADNQSEKQDEPA